MAKTAKFFGTKLSDNWTETPEGFLVCLNAVIARTGFQEYRGSELQDTEIEDIDGKIDSERIYKLYRPEDEVFNPDTIASFEGKSVTFTHPNKLITVETVADVECGHVQNVKRGTELLDDGNWPLLADLMIKDSSLIRKIKSGLRELSCGYNYHVAKQNGNFIQVGIIGNHVAVVENGRAGTATIQDSALVVPDFQSLYVEQFVSHFKRS